MNPKTLKQLLGLRIMSEEYINSTCGLIASHWSHKSPYMMRAEFTRIDSGVRITAISGNTLSKIKAIPAVTISEDEWQDSPHDPYDNTVQARWALRLLNISL